MGVGMEGLDTVKSRIGTVLTILYTLFSSPENKQKCSGDKKDRYIYCKKNPKKKHGASHVMLFAAAKK